ncbi:hypothetical protein GGI11_003441 [Coemansia sp. RSA 2049]|nr:hypothetical protein GGI11_003441 [Coemansia sp. RSA 2049]
MDGVKRVDGSGNAYRVGVLATIIANFVLASVSTVSTEQQRSSFGKLLVSKYDDLKAPLASDDFAWERLLLHYVFAEAGSRIDGMERWLDDALVGLRVDASSISELFRRIADGIFIASYAVEPLLRSLDAASFEATLVTTIRLAQKFGQSTATVASTMFTAYMHAGYRQASGDSDPAEKRKAVQKRLGSALTALHAALHAHPSVESALHVLGAIDELLLEPTMRFTTYDISEVLGTVFSVTTLPLGIDAGSTPWIVAYAPFNARCAESYARVLDDLVRSRRSTAGFTSSRKEMSSNSGSTRLKADISGFVKLTRGTNAASTAYVVGLFAPYILAEYCIIQGGGAQSAISLRALGRGGADNASGGNSFYGFGWRPTPVLAGMQDRSNVLPCDTLETNVSANSSGRRGVISSMAVREALLPGLHALLDVMGDDNRNTLLAQLAGPSNDTRQGLATNWSSLFGPDRYGGASEILKSLYKSYLDFYKYSGQV